VRLLFDQNLSREVLRDSQATVDGFVADADEALLVVP